MKTRFKRLSVLAALLGCIITLFISSCNKDEPSENVRYTGRVVYLNTTTPFPDCLVQVTDGSNIHCQAYTDADGGFSLTVRVGEINGNYYFLAGDATCVPKKVALSGYGKSAVDLGTIEVEGPSSPVVETKPIGNLSADGATCGGNVITDGRLAVTARGVCYSLEPYPTTDGLHTTDGEGLGEFTSNLKDLAHKTTYYVRAYATNKKGTSYGEQVVFTTAEGVPVVVTDSVYRITAHSARCKGHVESDGGYAVTKKGTCWSKQPDPTIDDDCTNDGSGKGEFTSALTNLQENTTYYVRSYATNSTATVYGEQIVITTLDGLAVVTTDSVNSVTATGFTAHGTVVSDCDIPVTARGFCYATTQYPTVENTHTTIGKGLGKYQSNIVNLKVGTIYYVRAYATNATETVYGEQIMVTTLNGLPVVTTSTQTTVTATTITAGGSVTDNGGFDITERGICYSATNSAPSVTDKKVIGGKGNGTFTVSITGLSAATKYYLRAYATNENGTVYGPAIIVTTKNGQASVNLSAVSNITALTASASVTVTDAGSATLQSCGICWSTNPNPTIEDSSTTAKGKQLNTAYTCNMSDLQPNTTYYVRAFATTDVTTAYSGQATFKTTTGLPVITTGAETVTASSITVTGEITANGGYNVTTRGFCYSKTNSEPTITDAKVTSGSGNGTFSASISNLTPATTYYFRAYATNSIGTAYGQVKTVTTSNGAANVTTGAITNVKALTATGSVTVTDAGGATLQSCGICWGTSPNPTTVDNKIVASGKQLNTVYSCNLSELQPNTTYYVRGYATTNITTTYGNQMSFKTTTGLAVVFSRNATAAATSITVTGEVTENGGYSVTERGICYSATNAEPTLIDSKIARGSGIGSFNATITALNASTQYYVRAYATNAIGISYGNTVPVQTKDGKAKITMGDITNITTSMATSNVTITDAGGATLQSCGICWSTNPNPTVADNKSEAGGVSLNTTYTCNMSMLAPGTNYNVRAYATTNITTVYSSVKSFATFIEVSGIVKNESGQAIPSANIIFKRGNTTIKSVTANTNGGFSAKIAAGSYNIEVTAQGYSNLTQQIYVDTTPITIVMKQLGILSGTVYDDDNIPLANATIKIKSSESSTLFSAVSNSDGTYRIENIPLGQTASIACTLSGYSLSSSIPNRDIISGINNLNIQMVIQTSSKCSPQASIFECTSEGMCGTTVTKTFTIQNNRQKSVSYSFSGVPAKGLKLTPSSGTISAKSSVIITATFTYPGPSVSGSVKTTLYNCIINNQRWTCTYLWNWSNSGMLNSDCNTWCTQNVTALVGNDTYNLDFTLYQLVVWDK